MKFESDEPEKQFIEAFRLAALQAGSLARRLQGEDPLTFHMGREPNVVAGSSELAEKILDVLDNEEGEHGGKNR